MTLKEKMKTYNFWVSLVSCLLLLAKIVAEQFGYSLSPSLATNIATIVCAVLVLFGLISAPGKKIDLKELETQTKEIIKQNEQLISQTKEDIEKNMEELGI